MLTETNLEETLVSAKLRQPRFLTVSDGLGVYLTARASADNLLCLLLLRSRAPFDLLAVRRAHINKKVWCLSFVKQLMI